MNTVDLQLEIPIKTRPRRRRDAELEADGAQISLMNAERERLMTKLELRKNGEVQNVEIQIFFYRNCCSMNGSKIETALSRVGLPEPRGEVGRNRKCCPRGLVTKIWTALRE